MMNHADKSQLMPITLTINDIPSQTSSPGYDEKQKLPLSKINEKIYLGAIDTVSNYDLLKENNIGYILNLTNSYMKIRHESQLLSLNQPISSKSFCCLMKVMPKCVEFITSAMSSNQNILICCRDGYSRTLVVLTAYYILKYNMDYQTVFDRLKSSIPNVNPNLSPKYIEHLGHMHEMVKMASSY